MKLRVVGGYGGELPGCRSTAFLVDGTIALDAGSLSTGLTLGEQVRLRHVLISHSHADHCASLTYLAENVFDHLSSPIRIHGSEEVVAALRRHVFNDVIWPDMASPRLPVYDITPLPPYVAAPTDHLTVTPVPVPHTVPCQGFHIDDGQVGLLYGADMAPNDTLWDFANRVERLDTLLVECSFPNRLQRLATVSKHLTPRDLDRELAKLQRPARILVYHLKPPHWDEIVEELEALQRPLTIIEQGVTYTV